MIKQVDAKAYSSKFLFKKKKFRSGYMKLSKNVTSNIIDEAIKFANKKSWWSFDGSFEMLHRYNSFRLEYISKYLNNKGSRMLEIGCGGGILSLPLSLGRGTSMNIHDINTENYQFIDFVSRNIKEYENFHTNHCELNSLGKNNKCKYDIILISEVLEHVREKEQFLKEYLELLAVITRHFLG